MRATLTFDLPEDAEGFELYRQAPRMYLALTNFRVWLRAAKKYHEVPPDAEEVWTEFHEILASEGVELE